MQPNYFNNGYGNYSYQQPQVNYQPNYQQPQPIRAMQSLFVLVNNDAEAQAYIVQPNQTVYLLNLKDLILTIKKADKDGMYEPEKYFLSKEKVENVNSDVKFATEEQFLNLQNNIGVLMDYIINNNLDLITIVVNHFKSNTSEEDILYKMGYRGLMKAAINYDMFCNLTFRTFALPYIVNSIVSYLN